MNSLSSYMCRYCIDQEISDVTLAIYFLHKQFLVLLLHHYSEGEKHDVDCIKILSLRNNLVNFVCEKLLAFVSHLVVTLQKLSEMARKLQNPDRNYNNLWSCIEQSYSNHSSGKSDVAMTSLWWFVLTYSKINQQTGHKKPGLNSSCSNPSMHQQHA